MDRAELVRLARIGATARLQAIHSEVEAIFKQFRGLRTGGSRDSGLGGSKRISRGAKVAAQPVKKARRRGLSAAGRKAIRLAQKKRWAEWKANQAKAAESRKAATSVRTHSGTRARKKR